MGHHRVWPVSVHTGTHTTSVCCTRETDWYVRMVLADKDRRIAWHIRSALCAMAMEL